MSRLNDGPPITLNAQTMTQKGSRHADQTEAPALFGNVDAFVQSRFLLMDGFHEVRQMLDRRSGYPAMLELIAHAEDDGAVVRSHVSPTRCAERFNVSRTQVRQLLLAAQARVWLTV